MIIPSSSNKEEKIEATPNDQLQGSLLGEGR
jgi:hypothetical protein